MARQASGALDAVVIATPCDASWEAMAGDDRVRRCEACDRDVFDLSQHTRAEAEALLAERASPCVRLYRRRDGTLLTRDCPVGFQRLLDLVRAPAPQPEWPTVSMGSVAPLPRPTDDV